MLSGLTNLNRSCLVASRRWAICCAHHDFTLVGTELSCCPAGLQRISLHTSNSLKHVCQIQGPWAEYDPPGLVLWLPPNSSLADSCGALRDCDWLPMPITNLGWQRVHFSPLQTLIGFCSSASEANHSLLWMGHGCAEMHSA